MRFHETEKHVEMQRNDLESRRVRYEHDLDDRYTLKSYFTF